MIQENQIPNAGDLTAINWLIGEITAAQHRLYGQNPALWLDDTPALRVSRDAWIRSLLTNNGNTFKHAVYEQNFFIIKTRWSVKKSYYKTKNKNQNTKQGKRKDQKQDGMQEKAAEASLEKSSTLAQPHSAIIRILVECSGKQLPVTVNRILDDPVNPTSASLSKLARVLSAIMFDPRRHILHVRDSVPKRIVQDNDGLSFELSKPSDSGILDLLATEKVEVHIPHWVYTPRSEHHDHNGAQEHPRQLLSMHRATASASTRTSSSTRRRENASDVEEDYHDDDEDGSESDDVLSLGVKRVPPKRLLRRTA